MSLFLMAGTRGNVIVVVLALTILIANTTASTLLEDPNFAEPIANVTAAVGREAILACVVDGLINYKVAWVRVDTQTILTIYKHVITKNQRIGVTHSEHRTWYLHIKDVKESDRGWYMCQINTDPMKSQVGYLDVVVPPDILDHESSADIVVNEGSNVSLRCKTKGFPQPSITWKRENGCPLYLNTGENVLQVKGEKLSIAGIRREQMGAYFCVASNGVPPSISKRIMVIVQFPPKIWTQYQLVGACDGQRITLQCNSEAFPTSINYWTGIEGEIISESENYRPRVIENGYRVRMELIIRDIRSHDYGHYKCISRNPLGETEGTINVYRLPEKAANKKVYSATSGKAASTILGNEIHSRSPPQCTSGWLVVLWYVVLSYLHVMT